MAEGKKREELGPPPANSQLVSPQRQYRSSVTATAVVKTSEHPSLRRRALAHTHTLALLSFLDDDDDDDGTPLRARTRPMGRKKRQKGCKLQVEKKKEKEKKARTTPTHRSRCERAAPLSAHFLSLSLCGLSLREPRTRKLLCDWLSSAARPGNPPRWREGVREGTEMIGGTHSAPVSYSSASAGRNCAYLCMRARACGGEALAYRRVSLFGHHRRTQVGVFI